MLKATFNNVIVKPQEEKETTFGTIIVPDLGHEKGLVGTIVSVGPGYYSATGTFIKSTLCEGLKVILPALGPSKLEYEGQPFWQCSELQVLSIIE